MGVYLTHRQTDRQGTGSSAAKILMRVMDDGNRTGLATRRIPLLLPLNFLSKLIEHTEGRGVAAVACDGVEIRHLLYEKKFTIDGARKYLNSRTRPELNDKDFLAELKKELTSIRDLLNRN